MTISFINTLAGGGIILLLFALVPPEALGQRGIIEEPPACSVVPAGTEGNEAQQRSCRPILNEATRLYENSMFRQIIRLFDDSGCTPETFGSSNNLAESEERLESYRILIDAWANEDEPEIASCFAIRLTNWLPNYEPEYDRFGTRLYKDVFRITEQNSLPTGTQVMPDDSLGQPGVVELDRTYTVTQQTKARVITQPRNLEAVSGDGEVSLSWRHGVNTATYTIHRRQERSGFDMPIEIITTGYRDTSYVDEQVRNGRTYTYYVSGMNAFARELGVTEETAPKSNAATAIPSGNFTLTVTSGDREMALYWTSPAEDETTFDVYRYASPDFLDDDALDALSIDDFVQINTVGTLHDASFTDPSPTFMEVDRDTLLRNDHVYYYRIATPSGSRNTLSNVAGDRPREIPPVIVSQPEDIVLNPEPELPARVVVSVYDPDDNISRVSILGFTQLPEGTEIPLELNGEGIYEGEIPGFSGPQLVRAEIHAVDDRGNQAVPLELTYNVRPSAPENFRFTAGDSEITLSWNAVPGVDGYRLYRNSDAVPFQTINQEDVTRWTDEPLQNGTSYRYRVTAFHNTSGESASASLSAIPRGPITLFPIVSAGDEIVHLEWESRDAAGPFDIYRQSGPEDALSQDLDESMLIATQFQGFQYEDRAVENGVLYHYWISSPQESLLSNRQPATPDELRPEISNVTPHLEPHPGPKDLVKISAMVTDQDDARENIEVTLNWWLDRVEQPDIPMLLEDLTDSTYAAWIPHTDCGDCTVTFQVEAVDAKNRRSTAGGEYTILLDRPTQFTANAGNSVVNLTWEGVAGARGYVIFRRTFREREFAVTTTTNTTSWADTTVQNDIVYIYRVAALGEHNRPGVLSEDRQAVPGMSVSSINAKGLDGGASFTWGPFENDVSYTVLCRPEWTDHHEIFGPTVDTSLVVALNNHLNYLCHLAANDNRISNEVPVMPEPIHPDLSISVSPESPDNSDSPTIRVRLSDEDQNHLTDSMSVSVSVNDLEAVPVEMQLSHPCPDDADEGDPRILCFEGRLRASFAAGTSVTVSARTTDMKSNGAGAELAYVVREREQTPLQTFVAKRWPIALPIAGAAVLCAIDWCRPGPKPLAEPPDYPDTP